MSFVFEASEGVIYESCTSHLQSANKKTNFKMKKKRYLLLLINLKVPENPEEFKVFGPE